MVWENNINDQDVLLLFSDMIQLVVDMLWNEMHYLMKNKGQNIRVLQNINEVSLFQLLNESLDHSLVAKLWPMLNESESRV